MVFSEGASAAQPGLLLIWAATYLPAYDLTANQLALLPKQMMQPAISWLDVDAGTRRRGSDSNIAHSPTIRHPEVGQAIRALPSSHRRDAHDD